jgi:hypothetical protein
MIDRFLYGHVTDMISFSIFPPVFNVADIAVTCGCGLLVFCLIYFDRAESSGKAASGEKTAEDADESGEAAPGEKTSEDAGESGEA